MHSERCTYWRIVFWQVSGCVDKDVGMLPCHANHLLHPRKAKMTTYDLEIGKLQRNFIDVWYRPTHFTGTKGSCVPDLGKEGYVKLYTLDE